jgi:hypothetical protein
MFITRKRLPFTLAEPTNIWFGSDFHIGASNVDYDFLQADLQEAADSDSRINIIGDVFDAILPKDHKRYKPEALHRRISMTSNVLDEAVDWGEEILAPFADRIDVIAEGNHESSSSKYHATSLIERLVRRLNQQHVTDENHVIRYGGYTGFIDYRFSWDGDPDKGNNRRLVVYYHHGGGGASPVTKGMIDFNRKATFIDSDVVVLGHKHNKISDTSAMRMSCPLQGEDPVTKQQVFVMCGAYMDTYQAGRGGYASDWGMAPQAKGGARLLVHFGKSGIRRLQLVH